MAKVVVELAEPVGEELITEAREILEVLGYVIIHPTERQSIYEVLITTSISYRYKKGSDLVEERLRESIKASRERDKMALKEQATQGMGDDPPDPQPQQKEE